MQRVTVTLEDDLLAQLDAVVSRGGSRNRSEALRDLLRAGLAQALPPEPGGSCVAVLTYVYDHARRDLPKLLADEFHAHHELCVSTLHLHLDQARCLEVAVLRGEVDAVRHMADHVTGERGVEYGRLDVLPGRAGRPGS